MTIKTELTGVMLAALLLTGSCFAQSPQKGPVTSFRDCAECPDMVVIPAGSFMMGDAGSKGEGPRHHVTIGYRFAVAKYPVTRDEYGRFVVESGYSAGDKWTKPPFPQTGNDPVVFVSWDDAKAYVKWLSVKTRHQYRLLSEAEYEYAEQPPSIGGATMSVSSQALRGVSCHLRPEQQPGWANGTRMSAPMST